MFLFRHPLRPLTHLGRVLLCMALALLGALLMLGSPPAHADDSDAPKAESPYFFVDSNDPSTDRLPLKSTSVDVRTSAVPCFFTASDSVMPMCPTSGSV